MAMGNWIIRGIVFISGLIVPLVLLGFGRTYVKSPPETVSPMEGYRTVMSMKNQDTWDFAQRCYGRTCWKIGWVLLPLTALNQILMLRCPVESMDFCFWNIGFVMLEAVAVVAAIYIPVERALKKTFDKNGNRR